MTKGKDRGFIRYDIFHVYYRNYGVVMEYINPQCLKNHFHLTDFNINTHTQNSIRLTFSY